MRQASVGLVIVCSSADVETLICNLPRLFSFHCFRHCTVIAAASDWLCITEGLTRFQNLEHWLLFHDEDDVLHDCSKEKFVRMYSDFELPADRCSWYFQQFLKLTFVSRFGSEICVVWDADCYPLSAPKIYDKTRFGMFVRFEGAVNQQYISMYRKLFRISGDICIPGNLVCERAIFVREHVQAFLREICRIHKVDENHYWNLILSLVERRDARLGFSEYASYALFCLRKYSDKYSLVPSNAFRFGNGLIDRKILNSDSSWVKDSGYEVVCFEQWDKPKFFACFLSQQWFYRRLVPFSIHLRFFNSRFYQWLTRWT